MSMKPYMRSAVSAKLIVPHAEQRCLSVLRSTGWLIDIWTCTDRSLAEDHLGLLLSFVCFCEGLRMPARRRWRFAHRRAAYANLQGRKPARCRASARQTLWEFRSAVFGRGSLTAGLGRCREEEEADRSIAIGGTALTQRRLNARRAVRHG